MTEQVETTTASPISPRPQLDTPTVTLHSPNDHAYHQQKGVSHPSPVQLQRELLGLHCRLLGGPLTQMRLAAAELYVSGGHRSAIREDRTEAREGQLIPGEWEREGG
eukprot:2832145-Rhodomonas_salina.4